MLKDCNAKDDFKALIKGIPGWLDEVFVALMW